MPLLGPGGLGLAELSFLLHKKPEVLMNTKTKRKTETDLITRWFWDDLLIATLPSGKRKKVIRGFSQRRENGEELKGFSQASFSREL